jgi:hypothetical protein
MKKALLIVAATLSFGYANAQMKLGDNPTTTNTNALLEMETTNKGLLLPRVALTSTTAFAPLTAHVAGMAVYNTATAGDVTPGYYFDNGTAWVRVADANASVSNLYTANGTLTGARTVTMGANNLSFMGTGMIGIGTTTPSSALHVVAATDPIKVVGLQSGASSDLFVSTDANGVFHTLSAAKPQVAAVTLSTATTTARGGAGSAYHFPTALLLVNTIPSATVATNGDITLPAGTYQVVLTINGFVASDATPPSAGFYMHSYFYDFKATGPSVRIHSNTSSVLGGASSHGISITYITTVNAGAIFPFNIGWGQGGNAGLTENMTFGAGCQLSVTKLL